MTDGILLEEIQKDVVLSSYSVIIIGTLRVATFFLSHLVYRLYVIRKFTTFFRSCVPGSAC